jgi:hypothetical protein
MKSNLLSFGAAFVFALVLGNLKTVDAQDILSGNLDFLKGQKSINVVFDFTNFKIEKETEQELVAREVEEGNKAEAGKGDKFKENWTKDRDEKFVAAFKKVLAERIGISTDDAAAQYTLIVYNIDLVNKGWGNKFTGGNPAELHVNFKFVETADQSKVMCDMYEGRTRYMATTGTLSQKIQGCLEYCTSYLAKNMKKKL